MLRRLGEGGASVVYLALDRERQQRVAVKVLRNLGAVGFARIEREFFSLKELRHPNLVQLGELFLENGVHYFTMELVEGCDFLTYVRPLVASRGYDESRLREALGQLASGVTALHRAGKVHRDIKPSNVLVTGDGRVVLVDFDLVADVVAGRQIGDVAPVGTTAYMAPEQSAGKPVSASADWYSVGVVLYQALAGRLPFSGSAIRMRMDQQLVDPAPPSDVNPAVPSDLDGICSELMRYNPKTRLRGRRVLERLGLEESRAAATGPSPLGADTVGATVPHVGRQRELESLLGAYADSRKGDTVAVVISGEAGLGKTMLVREFLGRLERKEPAVVTLAGRCYQSAPGPFKGFDTVVDALGHALESRADRHRAADSRERGEGQAALLTSELATAVTHLFPVLHLVPSIEKAVDVEAVVPNPQELRGRAFFALRTLLAALAEERPVVLFLDDLQWADTDSADLLAEIVDAPDATPLLLIATMRSEEHLGPSLSRLEDRARRLRVQPLSSAESVDLAEKLSRQLGLNAQASSGELSDIAGDARGHPLFIVEMVQHLARTSHGARAVSVEDAIRARISELSDNERTVLELVALAGTPLDDGILADSAQLARDECMLAVSLLLVNNLVRISSLGGGELFEPYHDRVRETVLAALDAAVRKRHHWNLARVLGLSPSREHREAVVRHLEGAGEHERAAEVAERTAQRAADALAFAQAANLYGVALRLGKHDRESRIRLHMALGNALCNAGRGAEASSVYLEATEDADQTARLDLQRRAAEQLLLAGHIDEGIEQLRLLLVEVGERLPRSPRTALLSLLRQRAHLRLRGLRWKERHEKEIPPSNLARFDAYQVVSDGLALVDNIRGADFQSRSLLLALRLGERRRVAHALCMEAVYLASQGGRRMQRSQALMEEARRLSQESQYPYIVAVVHVTSGIIDFFDGRFPRAREQLRVGEVMLRDQTVGSTWQLDAARVFQMHVLRVSGEIAEQKRLFDECVRDAVKRGDRYMEASMRRLSADFSLCRDRVSDVHSNLELAEWSPTVGGFHLQDYYEVLELTRVAQYEGRAAEALDALRPRFAALDHSLLLRIQVVRAETHWMLGKLLVASALEGANEGRLLAQAARRTRRLTSMQLPYGIAWASLLRAAIATQRGQWRRAADLLRATISTADQHAMPCVAACAQRRLGSLLKGDEGAALVAEGEAWMIAQGAVRPERLTEVYAPGFAPR